MLTLFHLKLTWLKAHLTWETSARKVSYNPADAQTILIAKLVRKDLSLNRCQLEERWWPMRLAWWIDLANKYWVIINNHCEILDINSPESGLMGSLVGCYIHETCSNFRPQTVHYGKTQGKAIMKTQMIESNHVVVSVLSDIHLEASRGSLHISSRLFFCDIYTQSAFQLYIALLTILISARNCSKLQNAYRRRLGAK
jgi:hypothetical protein